MSIALDANILLYASDSNSPHHRAARSCLESCVAGRELFCLAWPTIMAYLRIATHPAIFDAPLSQQQAMENVETLLRCPHARVLTEEEGFWAIYRATTESVPTRGNLVPDAHLTALLRQHGIRRLYSYDRDFRKFDFLEVIDPLVEQ